LYEDKDSIGAEAIQGSAAISLRPRYFRESAPARANTLFHELTHALAKTDDFFKFIRANGELIDNAYSYEDYFERYYLQ
jgi:hypothetical protein